MGFSTHLLVSRTSTLFSETPNFTGILSTNLEVYLTGSVLEPQLRTVWQKMVSSGDPQSQNQWCTGSSPGNLSIDFFFNPGLSTHVSETVSTGQFEWTFSWFSRPDLGPIFLLLENRKPFRIRWFSVPHYKLLLLSTWPHLEVCGVMFYSLPGLDVTSSGSSTPFI